MTQRVLGIRSTQSTINLYQNFFLSNAVRFFPLFVQGLQTS